MSTTMISLRLSEDRLRRLDELVAKGEASTRAAAMVAAIDAWLELAERRRIDAAIVEGYTRIPQTEDDELHRVAEAAAQRSIAEEPW
jgi:Arc/MetJ-type ribon-helix-helix transcriptional regulator